MPNVSVLMSVHNGERYLAQSIDSLLEQTYQDFEIILIDDASTDSSPDIIQQYDVDNIKYIRNQENIGLTKSLNKGLELAQGNYIARMDADDVSLPKRFDEQVRFLDHHPEIGVVGSSCVLIDEENEPVGTYQLPTNDLEIRWRCMLANPFAHPSVMVRKTVLDENGLRYDESYRCAQDYELWSRLLLYTQGTNFEEPFLWYRTSGDMTTHMRKEQLINCHTIAYNAIQRFIPENDISYDEVFALQRLLVLKDDSWLSDRRMIFEYVDKYLKLLKQFLQQHPQDKNKKNLLENECSRLINLLLKEKPGFSWLVCFSRLFRFYPPYFFNLRRISGRRL